MAPKLPSYVQRFARIPAVLAHLEHFPDGLPLPELAAAFGVDPRELREDILAFYTADVGASRSGGFFRRSVVEFLGSDGGEVDPVDAAVIRVTDARPAEELGVSYLDAAELALLFQAAADLLELEPDDEHLAAAVRVLQETMLASADRLDDGAIGAALEEHGPGVRPAEGQPAVSSQASLLNSVSAARAECRALRITYSRAWRPGLSERVIHPYVLRHTRRGWEVDAGPIQADGSIRTFLVSNVRSADVLPETFEVPESAAAAIEASRRPTAVEVVLPHRSRWVADRFAEQVEVLDQDEDTLLLRLALLPPLPARLGLLLTIAGPSAFVRSPAPYVTAAEQLAGELLEHHASPPPDEGSSRPGAPAP